MYLFGALRKDNPRYKKAVAYYKSTYPQAAQEDPLLLIDNMMFAGDDFRVFTPNYYIRRQNSNGGLSCIHWREVVRIEGSEVILETGYRAILGGGGSSGLGMDGFG